MKQAIRQREPQPETSASERIEVKLLANKNKVDIGVLCYNSEPDKVAGTQMRRDASLESDALIQKAAASGCCWRVTHSSNA